MSDKKLYELFLTELTNEEKTYLNKINGVV